MHFKESFLIYKKPPEVKKGPTESQSRVEAQPKAKTAPRESVRPDPAKAELQSQVALEAMKGAKFEAMETKSANLVLTLPLNLDKSGKLVLNIREIKKLTPMTARWLVASVQNLKYQGENPPPIEILGSDDDRVRLDGLEALDPATAIELGKSHADSLILLNLKSLDPETAKGLAQFEESDLYLGINFLDHKTAAELAKSKAGAMDLNLTALDKNSAAELAKFPGESLILDSLIQIDSETARGLAKFAGADGLSLDALQSIDSQTALVLSSSSSGLLSLNGLGRLDKETAQALAKYKSELHLKGLKVIDKETAQELTKFAGDELILNSEIIVNDQLTARALVRNPAIRFTEETAVTSEYLKKALEHFREDTFKVDDIGKLVYAHFAGRLDNEIFKFTSSEGVDFSLELESPNMIKVATGDGEIMTCRFINQGRELQHFKQSKKYGLQYPGNKIVNVVKRQI